MADARARVPELHVAAADPVGDNRGLEALADWAHRYTPMVAIDRQSATVTGGIGGDAGLWLDVTGCAHLFGGEEEMLLDLRHRLEAQGLTARAAMAGTPAAAWALARFAAAEDGVLRIEPGAEADALAALPVSALRLPPVVSSALNRLGLKRIDALAASPRAPLVARFGEVVARRLDQALGQAEEPLAAMRPLPVFRARLAFPDGIGHPDDLALAARRLCERLVGLLDQAQQGAKRIELAAYRLDGEVKHLSLGFARAVRDPVKLFRLLADRIGQIEPGEGIEVMILAVLAAEPLVARQASMVPEAKKEAQAAPLAAQAPEDSVVDLIDRLSGRLGEEAVHRLVEADSHVPERAQVVRPPLTVIRGARRPPRRRPLRLLDRPEPVQEVMSLVPDQPPLRFRWRGRTHKVTRADPAERIAGEWWREDAPTRDYFRVEDEEGRRFWLRRDGLYDAQGKTPPSWSMHGFFA